MASTPTAYAATFTDGDWTLVVDRAKPANHVSVVIGSRPGPFAPSGTALRLITDCIGDDRNIIDSTLRGLLVRCSFHFTLDSRSPQAPAYNKEISYEQIRELFLRFVGTLRAEIDGDFTAATIREHFVRKGYVTGPQEVQIGRGKSGHMLLERICGKLAGLGPISSIPFLEHLGATDASALHVPKLTAERAVLYVTRYEGEDGWRLSAKVPRAYTSTLVPSYRATNLLGEILSGLLHSRAAMRAPESLLPLTATYDTVEYEPTFRLVLLGNLRIQKPDGDVRVAEILPLDNVGASLEELGITEAREQGEIWAGATCIVPAARAELPGFLRRTPSLVRQIARASIGDENAPVNIELFIKPESDEHTAYCTQHLIDEKALADAIVRLLGGGVSVPQKGAAFGDLIQVCRGAATMLSNDVLARIESARSCGANADLLADLQAEVVSTAGRLSRLTLADIAGSEMHAVDGVAATIDRLSALHQALLESLPLRELALALSAHRAAICRFEPAHNIQRQPSGALTLYHMASAGRDALGEVAVECRLADLLEPAGVGKIAEHFWRSREIRLHAAELFRSLKRRKAMGEL